MGCISILGLVTVLAVLGFETGHSKVLISSDQEFPRETLLNWRDWRYLSLSAPVSAGDKPYSLDRCYVYPCTELFDTTLVLLCFRQQGVKYFFCPKPHRC